MLLRISGIVKPLTIIIYISGSLLPEEATVIGSVSTDIEQFLYMVPTFILKN